MDINHEFDFTLLSRLPTRRLIEKLDLSKVSNYWITNTDNENSIKPHIDEVMNISRLIRSNKSAMIYFLDPRADLQKVMRPELFVKLTGFIRFG